VTVATDAEPLTIDGLRARTTVSVEEAARVLGISRGGAYDAARRGDLPTMRIGRRLRVPVPILMRMLDPT